jgi:hypothetical protein
VTDVAHVFDLDSAIGSVGGFGRSGRSDTCETSEAYPNLRALKGFRRHWEKKLVEFMAGNVSHECHNNESRKYAVGSHRDVASFCCSDPCEAQSNSFHIELIALTHFEERGYLGFELGSSGTL